jgi:hypothetical protein
MFSNEKGSQMSQISYSGTTSIRLGTSVDEAGERRKDKAGVEGE